MQAGHQVSKRADPFVTRPVWKCDAAGQAALVRATEITDS
jgi:hypothetical protein